MGSFEVLRIPTTFRALWLFLLLAWLAIPVSAAPADFPEYPELRRDVTFWMRVYTEITTEQGFLHDEQNLGVVYGVMELPVSVTGQARQDQIDSVRDRHVAVLRTIIGKWQLANAALVEQENQRRADALRALSPAQATATLGYDRDFVASLLSSAQKPARAALPAGIDLTAAERRVVDMFGDEISLPRLVEAAGRVRFQLGQADRFRGGVVRSGAWESHIARTFASLGLPAELAALPHVESSFNPAAYSKVGAAGLWQFMRSTGKLYMRIDDDVDERLDPYRATDAAAQLLSYNYRLLGSWPLAITAYNHGAAGMRRARDAMGTTDMAVIARGYRSPSFGFASRNFYPSFLAVLRIDREPQKYFPGVVRAREIESLAIELPAWVPLSAIEQATGYDAMSLRPLNPALRDPVWNGERHVPRGYVLRLPVAGDKPLWTQENLLAALPADRLYAGQLRRRSHVVRKGETLVKIARRYGVRSADLAALNGIDARAAVRRGSSLRLPDVVPPLWQRPGSTAVVATNAPVEAAVPAAGVVATARNTVAELPQAPPAKTPDASAPDETANSAVVALEPLSNDRYQIDADGSVRALGGESLALLADWSATALTRLRALNPEVPDALQLGSRLRLEFATVSREDFSARRRAWHTAMQSAFFETHRIVGSENYRVRPGDTLWSVLQKFPGLPSWLLEQYNPNVNLVQLRASTNLVIPKVAR